VLFVTIPNPATTVKVKKNQPRPSLWQEIKLGFDYLLNRPSLLNLVLIATLFQFSHDIGKALYSPMILARTGNDAQVLGMVSAAAGIGGIFGSVMVSIWRMKGQKINWFLWSMIGAGVAKTLFGIGQSVFIWFPSQLISSINFPVMGSAKQGLFLSQVKPDFQGRVIAMSSTLVGVASPLAKLIAGPLADQVFTPAMAEGGLLTGIFGGLFGVGEGAGIALLYTFSSIGLIIVGIVGYRLWRW
jgi:hypothetical protein